MASYEQKLEAAIDAYCVDGRTPEQFGELLAVASEVFYRDPLLSKEYLDKKWDEIRFARAQLKSLPYGHDILNKEMWH